MSVTTTDSKPKSYYSSCRKVLAKVGGEKLVELGNPEHKNPYEIISPKNYFADADGRSCVLIREEEFGKPIYFVLTTNDWTHISDGHNVPIVHVDVAKTSDITLFTIPEFIDKSLFKLSSFSTDDKKIYQVPISYLNKYSPVEDEKKSVVIEKKSLSKKEIADVMTKSGSLFEDDTDENINALTIRDFYSIVNSIPASNKEWLNNVIKTGNVIRNNRKD